MHDEKVINKRVKETVREALVLLHESSKTVDWDEPEETQARVWEAWHAIGYPGEPWEH
jgi:hypothetical protein